MPELPEVEIVKKSLFKMINKAKITNVKINNKNLRYEIPKNFSKSLIGEKIFKISRRSKYLVIHLKNKYILIHLGMTGKILLLKKKNKELFKTSFYYNMNILPQHNHIYFTLSNGYTLIYNDVRRFGFFKFYKNTKLSEITHLKNLGFEPLNNLFNSKYFKSYIKNKKKNIKNLLMDQRFVSGLGNIYVNEALFLSRIQPERSLSSLTTKEIKKLILNIKSILKLAIIKGGSSIRDFKNISGKTGSFQQYFRVYGKENNKCSRISCTGRIIKIFISNRSSFYCKKCQN
tara:strand:+ start:182 stop:1045 length:864 start_codon:yes stop_codon:yes gene_type:complete